MTASKKQLGQFFTTQSRVQDTMARLVTHTHGAALEPSAGVGHLAAKLASARPGLDICAFELDTTLSWEHPHIALHHGDFFDLATKTLDSGDRYDVIFGNPPFVAWKDVTAQTRRSAAEVKSRYHDKANLYHLFIDRSIDLLSDGGELVFIVPLEWCYTTAAAELRKKMTGAGAVTDFIHCGEEKLFDDASVPALCIFRFVRGAAQGPVRYAASLDAQVTGRAETRKLVDRSGRWLMLPSETAAQISGWGRFGDQFDVRVGLVTGADSAFKLDHPDDAEPGCVLELLTTRRGTEPFLYLERYDRLDDIPPRARALITAHRDRLLARRIASFDDTNWWKYGAVRNIAAMASPVERFFALAKTRHPEPFFTHPDATHYSGGVLGLFRRPGAVDIGTAVAVANSHEFRRVLEAMFLTTGTKLTLQPATLADAPFPATSAQAAELTSIVTCGRIAS